MKPEKTRRRWFKRASKAIARDRGRKAYEKALVNGMPREQAKQFAKVTEKNSLK